MSTDHRRLDRLEHRGRPDPFVNHPARIPAWVRPWLDPLAIDDPEILEACRGRAPIPHRICGAPSPSGGAPTVYTPESGSVG
jgi:hypothetical protein